MWNEELVSVLLARELETTLYVSGTVSNQGRFYLRFDAIVLLSAPADVLLRRIESRTTNAYGKSVDERERIVSDITDVEPLLRATCTHELDATRSVAAVVAELITIGEGVASRPLTRSARGRVFADLSRANERWIDVEGSAWALPRLCWSSGFSTPGLVPSARRHVTRLGSSPGWTRTNNPSVNSRMLCQLSYRGRSGAECSQTRRARVRWRAVDWRRDGRARPHRRTPARGRLLRAGRSTSRGRSYGSLPQAIDGYFADRCRQHAAGIAYRVLFSLVPLSIVLVAIFGIVLQTTTCATA